MQTHVERAEQNKAKVINQLQSDAVARQMKMDRAALRRQQLKEY